MKLFQLHKPQLFYFELTKINSNFAHAYTMEKLEELKGLLSAAKRIFITTHQKPDGDALGSSLGLYHILKRTGHDVKVIAPTDYPDFLSWLPGNDEVIIFEEKQSQALEFLDQSDIIFCLDFNDLKRVNNLGGHIKKSKAKKVLIDHHLEPTDFDDYRLWTNHASSTAELVYDFICLIGQEDLVDVQVAECIYTGMMTDTGSFRFSSTTPRSHQIAARLIEKGLAVSKIHELIFDTFTEKKLRFFGYALHEKLKVLPEYNAAYFAITSEELSRFALGTGDTEGLVNYALAISGIKLAAFISDRTPSHSKEKIIKLSLRSKGEVPANEICRKYFNGGGHKNAAGGQTRTSLEETTALFEKILSEYKDILLS